jgi:hypothetical protein
MPEVKTVEQDGMTLAAVRSVIRRRAEAIPLLEELAALVPGDAVKGPPVLVLRYVSSVREGTLVDLGFPVEEPVARKGVETVHLRPCSCLSVIHSGPLSGLGDAYGALFGHASERGIISDEYGLEILHDFSNADRCRVEARLVVHPWEDLFHDGLGRHLDPGEREEVFGGCRRLQLGSSLDERFREVKAALERLEPRIDDFARYECLSGCAHVFPREQIAKLRDVFRAAREEGLSFCRSVDRVTAFMEQDPGWGEKAFREGTTVYASKGPRDREAFDRASSPEDRARAACFCPIIRERLQAGMPRFFCYCGAGWYRQQWEGATGVPVRVEILSSLLRGDDACRFAVTFPGSE